MAYIPDDAIDDCKQISASAFRLYCLLCRKRNHKTGWALIDKPSASRLLDIGRAQIYRAFAELESKQWIETNGYRITPLHGSFAPMDKWLDPVSHFRDSQSQFVDKSSHKRDSTITSLIPALDTNEPEAGEIFKECPQCTDGLIAIPLTGELDACPHCIKGALLKSLPIQLQRQIESQRLRNPPQAIV